MLDSSKTDQSHLDEARESLHQLLATLDPDPLPLLVLGNKNDVTPHLSVAQIVGALSVGAAFVVIFYFGCIMQEPSRCSKPRGCLLFDFWSVPLGLYQLRLAKHSLFHIFSKTSKQHRQRADLPDEALQKTSDSGTGWIALPSVRTVTRCLFLFVVH